jgi:3-isopropylmalate/(R)-2-methylmalate dehydratase small subunit
MTKKGKLKGKVWKFGDNINTDLIVTNEYLTSDDPNEIVQHAFEDILPNFADMVKKGDIIVAGKNFGSGSSREEAVFVIKELGISAVICQSFSRIYFRNLINQGIPAIVLQDGITEFETGDEIIVDINLGSIENKTKNRNFKFTPIPEFIMDIINSGGALNQIKSNLS